MDLTINGERQNFDAPITVEQLLGKIGLDPRKVAVERNLEIVPKSEYSVLALDNGDTLEIVHFIGGGAPDEVLAKNAAPQIGDDSWEVAGRRFTSRLIIGTGKYKDYETNRLAAEAAGSEVITVAVRRVNLTDPDQPMLVDFLDPKKFTYLPNTAGCFTADDAVRTLRLAREAGG
ncbi:MAG: Thiazole synthase, partial [Alphaproteobacteria bacterium MarineAlpha3_Bin1]